MLAAMPSEVALEQVGDGASAPVATVDETLATAVTRNGPAQASEDQDAVAMAETQPALSPLNRYLLQCPISKETHDLLRYAQALLSHAIPDGEMDQLLQRALKALIPQLEKGKVAVLTRQSAARRSVAGQSRPQVRKSNRPSSHGTELPAIAHAEGTSRRPIPAEVRRAVWERDKRQCTFVGTNGHRCGARRLLEFDHINPVARGGASTVNNIRLRCRAHNQYEAERVLGADLMTRKREARTEAMKSTSGRGSPTCSGAS